MCSKTAHPFFHLFPWGYYSWIKRCLQLIFVCMKCDHPATGKCPEIKTNKDMKEIKQHTYPLQIPCFCGWAQQFNFIHDLGHASVFTTDSTGTTTLLPAKQRNAQSSNSHRFTFCFIHTVQLLQKYSFITLHLMHSDIICCKRMFSNNNTSMTTALSLGVTRKWILWQVFSLLLLTLCVWYVLSTCIWIPSLPTTTAPEIKGGGGGNISK